MDHDATREPQHGVQGRYPRRAVLVFTLAAACGLGLRASRAQVAGQATTSGITTEDPATILWSDEDLAQIIKADDLHIAPFREDGATYGTPTWIWSVAVDGSLYVRAYNGQSSRWYQAAMRQKAGRIIAAGMTKEVAFEPVEGPINDRIDGAYRAKYQGSPYLEPMVSARTRSATVKIVPRG